MSQKLIEMLSEHEGIKSYAYTCPAGKITVGIGRNIDPEGGLGLSPDEIVYLVRNDIKRCEEELGNAFPWFNDLEDCPRRDALIDIAFNLGITRLRLFKKALACMERQEYAEAAVEFLDSKWARQVKGRAITVTDMIRTNTYV